MKRLNVAVIGAGILGEIHAETYAQYDKSELLWVCDLCKDRSEKIAAKFNCKSTTDYMEIANDKNIQVVNIATLDFAHTKIALQMIKSGKDLLIEKPLTADVAEAESIVNEAKKANVKVMVDFQNRWSPTFSQIKKSIENREIRKPVMGYIRPSNPYWVPMKIITWGSKSGPQWFLFPHIIDLMRWFIGQEASLVYAVGTKGILKEKGIDAYECNTS